jgi:hypothetical protein
MESKSQSQAQAQAQVDSDSDDDLIQQRPRYIPPPPHRRPADAEEFLATLDEKNRQLHEIATRFLGSSYFMNRCHGYLGWKKAQASATAPAKK